MKKSSVSIIGGADGPTSVFVAGRTGKIPFKVKIKRKIYQHKRKRVIRKIKPGAHSLEEVVDYITKVYGATEVPETAHRYMEQRKCLKESLIIENRPELLGDMQEIHRPEEYNEDTIKELHQQLQRRSEFIANIPDEHMPMDFHMYEIRWYRGKMSLDIDFKWDILGCSYSGSKQDMKQLRKISREIYTYYGVSEDDIRNNTKRYSSLITTLSSD